MKKCDLSFIIPALNEEEHIGKVLDSISESVNGHFQYEVIVVDNGSKDRTVSISDKKGAACLSAPGCTISTLRNIGAAKSNSDILVFLDADVYLEKDWGMKMVPVVEMIYTQTQVITGSLYGISKGNNWIERIWFAPRATQKVVNYINGGHLIIHRSLFTKTGGFDPELETGEDYEFCARARQMGVRIENNLDLNVVHAGYPKSIRSFFIRERWHGRGDFKSFKTVANSIPAIISVINLWVAAICIIGSILLTREWFSLLISYNLFLVSVSLASAMHRCQGRINLDFPGIAFIYIIYFSARTVSIMDVALNSLLTSAMSTFKCSIK